MAFEPSYVFRYLTKTDRVPAEASVNSIDDRRQTLMPFIRAKQIRLMMDRRHKPQECDPDAHRFHARHVVPKLSQPGEQKPGILGFREAALIPPVPRSPIQRR